MKVNQKRARKGGEYGVNGEFYEGGKFLPNTEKPKAAPRKRATRKQQWEAYKWERPAEGWRAIYKMVGVQAAPEDRYDRENNRIKPFAPGINSYGDEPISGWTTAELCELFNAGVRWVRPR